MPQTSLVGQAQPFADVCSMSALERIADSSRASPEVREVPHPDMASIPLRQAAADGVGVLGYSLCSND